MHILARGSNYINVLVGRARAPTMSAVKGKRVLSGHLQASVGYAALA